MEVNTSDRIGTGQLTCLRRCPHCGISRPQIVKAHIADPIQPLDGSAVSRWAVYRCTSCSGWITAKGQPGSTIANPLIVEVFPGLARAHEDLPEIARKYLDQAMETLGSPDASGVMSGSAVDAMLKALGYEKGSVYERIDQAVEGHKITADMGEWAHSVRLGSNRPRHADKDNPHVSREEAQRSVEFAEALGNFLFVLTARIERGIKSAQEGPES